MSSNIYLPHPSLPYVCFSSLSLTRRPIMHAGSTTERQPAAPFARKAFRVKCMRANYSFPRQICASRYAQHTWEIALLMYAPHGNWRANTLATAGFYCFLVNNSNFFCYFYAYASLKYVPDQYLKYQRETSTHGGTYNRTDRQTDLVFLLVKILR